MSSRASPVCWLFAASVLCLACASEPATPQAPGARRPPAAPSAGTASGAADGAGALPPPTASTSGTPEQATRQTPGDPLVVGPLVNLPGLSFRIQQPPHTHMGYEWKGGRGLSWMTFDHGPHRGESIFFSIEPGGDVQESVATFAKPYPGFTRSVIDAWFEGGVGIVDKQNSFRDDIDCRTTPGCNRSVLVVQKIGAVIVQCLLTDYRATDDWARTTALQVCKTIVP